MSSAFQSHPMNLTALLATALATNNALYNGWTADPGTVALIDAIYRISGADPCAFNACTNGTRVLYGPIYASATSVEDVVAGRGPPPDAYDQDLYGDLFGWCRDFMNLFPSEHIFSNTLRALDSSAVDQLVKTATAYQTCTGGEMRCMCTACDVDIAPLKRAAQAAASVEAALVRRVTLLNTDIHNARNQIMQYYTTVADEPYDRSWGSGGSGGIAA